MNLARAFVTVSGLTVVSRVLGYVRDVLIAAGLGAGLTADAFFVAFKVPGFFRRLFAEGGFSAAFVPLFAGRVETDGPDEAKRLADETLAVLLATLLVLVLLAEIAMPLLVAVMAPGFDSDPAKFALTVELTRITFPYLLLISLVALFGGMLNSLGRFAAFAAAPILLNLALIAAALVARFYGGIGAGHALAWGVSLGGVAQLLLLIAGLRAIGLMPRLLVPRLTPAVKRLLLLFLPAAFGAGVFQINLMVDQIVASFLPTGAISYLYYADRIDQLPLGVVGIAVGTALLPLLSRQIAAGDEAAANASQSRAVEFVMLLTLPSAAAFLVIARPVIAVLFQRGAFDATATDATAAALVAFATGLPAYVLVKVFAPGFFARQDTKTPVQVASVALVANIVLNLILVWPLAHVGIALATALAAWLNGGILWLLLVRRGHFRPDARLKRRLPRMVLASAIMMGVLWLLGRALGIGHLGGGLAAALPLAVLIAGGAVVYAVACQVLGAWRLADLRSALRPAAVAAPQPSRDGDDT